MQFSRRTSIGFFAASLLVGGADRPNRAWQKKKFSDWTTQDAQELMTDSPWAKQKALPAAGRPAMTVVEGAPTGMSSSAPTGASASLGNPADGNAGPGMTAGSASVASGGEPSGGRHTAISPSGMHAQTGAPVIHPPITIFWASASPIRLAILKLRANGGQPSDEEVTRATAPRESYTVAVSGLPVPEGGVDAKALAKNASLKTKSHGSLTATESSYRRIGDSDVYFFRFSRQALPLTTGENTVEFRMKLGTMEVNQAFALGQMEYDGRLAL